MNDWIDVDKNLNSSKQDEKETNKENKNEKSSVKINRRSYSANYLIDYGPFCVANKLKDASKEQKKKFIDDTPKFFRNEATPAELIEFFEIQKPKDEKKQKEIIDDLSKRRYDIAYVIVKEDFTDHKIMLRITLSFNSGLILPTGVK